MRHTETELDKIIRIGFSKIDQITNECCEKLNDLQEYVFYPTDFSYITMGMVFKQVRLRQGNKILNKEETWKAFDEEEINMESERILRRFGIKYQ